MAWRLFPRFRISIKLKLLLVASSLLVIPWIGTLYIQEMESYLRKQQEDTLLTRTQMVAAVMQGNPDLFSTQTVAPLPTRHVYHVFVRPLPGPIQLDGYLDDWMPYEERMQRFTANNALKGSETTSLSFQHQLGTYKDYLYVLFKVDDDKIIYRQPNSLYLHKSDHLFIAIEDTKGKLKNYIVTTLAPGWVNAHQVSNDIYQPDPIQPIPRIKGEWQETASGYNIELRIPLSYIGNRISFAIADVDHPVQRQIDTIIATAGLEEPASLGTLMFPSEQAEKLLARLQRPLTRTWVIDQNNRVIARTGSLVQHDDDYLTYDENSEYSFLTGLMSLLYKMILKQPATEFHDELLNASRLNSEEFRHALAGDPDTRWRQTPDKEVNILTATYPVRSNGKVIGAVAIEKTSNSILLVQNRAMEIMFNLSALAFIIASVVLLLFATRLIQRVRRLRDATSQAITSDGRVVGRIEATHDRDEIGDLSRDVSDMLDRLSQYNRYLEGMAGKLSHELRTPITVVRSSLDNLHETSDPKDIKTYSDRASQGIERLNNILTRMSEATRLEQTMQSEQRINFDIQQVIQGCIEGYRIAHPNVRFNFSYDKAGQYQVIGAPDLVAQLLDKLISNAIDFMQPATAIEIKLRQEANTIVLSVSNTGPVLPAEMQANLFESMVSVRDKKAEQPHLGLGLYIVRLITEFHHGRVYAANKTDNSGVEFHVEFPVMET
ncbi:MAG: proteobacterial dedicated sortase system histidine kinase [Thioalkalispiraceae bacterium]|jgi:dedicated sortase system histidine kinase